MCTCVLLDAREGLLEGIGGCRALGGVCRQAVGVHGFYWVTIGLVRNSTEAINNGCHDAWHGRGGQICRRRAQTCSDKEK